MSLLHQDDEHDQEAPEREVTLSTGALLGIFAGLVLLCALFFALGYSVRGRQTVRPMIATTAENTPSSNTNFNTFKPAAGSPAFGSGASTRPVAPPTPEAAPASSPPEPSKQPTDSNPGVPREAAPLAHPPATTPNHPATVPSAPIPAVIPEGSFIVQVAAVSHPEDAQYVVAALKAKGYPAASRTEPQDKLFHIQVGPYTNRKDAEAIKLRLNNPIVK
jgi:cell division septation protein DedD